LTKKFKTGAINTELNNWKPLGHDSQSRSTLERIWKRYISEYNMMTSHMIAPNELLVTRKKGIVGRKRKFTEETSFALMTLSKMARMIKLMISRTGTLRLYFKRKVLIYLSNLSNLLKNERHNNEKL
jgi:hypothetical protein